MNAVIGTAVQPPLVRPPDPNVVFARRAERFESLAAGSSMADFLSFMAAVAHAQAAALDALPGHGETLTHQPLRAWSPLSRSAGEGAAAGLDASWRQALATIIERLSAGPLTTETSSALQRLAGRDAEALDALADRALRFASEEPAEGCLALAALQVSWTRMAGLIEPGTIKSVEPMGICPVCGSPPVASIVHSAGSVAGSRFLVCSMCATEWHLVRIKCANCDSTGGIAYLEIEGAGGLVKAETCEECRTYTKIVYTERDPRAEPFADDVASLGLDLLVDEAGWRRANPNPFLLPGAG